MHRSNLAPIIREDVLNALSQAEARGEKRVRVIIGLRSPKSLDTVKQALARMVVKTVARESPSFVVAALTREEILQVSKLAEYVRAIWLDSPVSGA
jgi:2-iminoacetate synthase ThiH